MTIFIVAIIAIVSVLQVSSAQIVYADGTDFGLSISQPPQIGCTATYTISYIPYGGFMETVAETASGVPMATFSMGTFFLSVVTTDTLFVSNL
jgi:hypothetical protein